MRKFAVIGLGKLGTTVAKFLAERGAEVIAVDKNADLVDELKEIVDLAVKLDATDEEALRSQGIDKVDVAIVSMGENFEAAVMATALLKGKLGVPLVITRASPTESGIREKILKLVGADRVVLPEVEMGQKLAQSLLLTHIVDYVPISEKYSAAEIEAPRSFWGKKIGDLNIRQRHKVNILEIKRSSLVKDGKKTEKINYLPHADDLVEEGDLLLVLGELEDIELLSEG